MINLDFSDVRTIMKNAGDAIMGIGRASGENRAAIAAQQAIESPLLETKIDGARGVLYSVAGGYDLSQDEIREASDVITGSVAPDANIIFGASIRPELEDEIMVTVIATGFNSNYLEPEAPTVDNIDETPSTPVEEHPAPEAKDFATDTKSNIWDTIKTEPEPVATTEDDDMDIPPSLRERLKAKKKK